MRAISILTFASSIASLVYASPLTPLHEPGRCAIRGSCKSSFFGPTLPCPDNGKAETPSDTLRTKLVNLCGAKWEDTDVCCDESQVDALQSNLKTAQKIIASCPACKENFFNLFCTFTCSPNQSQFINVTKTVPGDKGKVAIDELDNLWSDTYQSGFFDSCKEVKMGLTGGRAMDFIGGGAKVYPDFLKFLGKKSPLFGSPFQINFIEEPRSPGEGQGMKPVADIPKKCNDEDPSFRCTCVDCPGSCTELPAVKEAEYCHVGKLPCLSFAVIVIYSICLLLLVMAISGHVWYAQHRQRKSERLQLLQDAAPSDDEDEGDLVHNAGLLDRPQRNYYLNQIFDRAFSKLGRFCATYPATTIGTNVVIIAFLSLGWLNFEVERDPVRLWVSPTSAAAQEKAYFDSNFGPFYRAEQVFLVDDSSPNSTVMTYENLRWWLDEEQRLSRVKSQEYGLTLSDVCYNPTGDACVVLSISGWFANTGFDKSWKDQIETCANQPGDQSCLPPFLKPLSPSEVLGGFNGTDDVLNAKALTITWTLNNFQPGTEGEKRAEDWEKTLKHEFYMVQQGAADRGLRMSFNTERSLEEELNKSTNTDAKIVVISYIVMFIYASLALGSGAITLRTLVSNPSNAFVQSKFTLGVVGILIVLMSVSGSVGLFSAAGIKVTLIIAEVIPFLVLAVGVDNIFLIVHEFERVNVSHPDEEIEDRIAKALGRMGPSILLSASTETVAFAMGCFVGMPAVKNFAAYAAGAVLINALLQVTMFVSVLALNQRRVESLRADCFPCVTVRRAQTSSLPGGHFFGSDEEGFLQKFVRRTYAPALLDKKVKTLVMLVFFTLFAAGIALLPKIELGLDQRIALPSDSYMIQYFDDLYDYFGTGPPVYFVTRNLNLTQRKHQKEVCGQFGACDPFSIGTILEQESKRSNVSYIAEKAPANWIDQFFTWLNPDLGGDPDLGEDPCCIEADGSKCLVGRFSYDLKHMPVGEEFISYAQRWITSPTSESCPSGGKVLIDAVVIDSNHTTIPASHFRTFHTPLQSQKDLINSYASARRIAADISEYHDIDVFPYSKHYIFFDQYRSIVRLTATLLCIGVVIVFLLTSLLLGSLLTGAVVAFTVIMVLIDIMGVMALANVSLNAVSLVNLSICTGIAVEFCAHISRAFTYPSKNIMERARQKFRGKDLRAWTALVNVGGSVFSGITITKFLGVFVLAFTRSKIFEVYYFRIWLALVCLGAAHALIFLPVALSFFGGEGYTDPESDGGLEEDLASRRYRSLMPDDDYSDDD